VIVLNLEGCFLVEKSRFLRDFLRVSSVNLFESGSLGGSGEFLMHLICCNVSDVLQRLLRRGRVLLVK
jgi:hypothetical protein